ncbi:MAG: hypothetical protein ABI281_01520 [Caldimonas sp.]
MATPREIAAAVLATAALAVLPGCAVVTVAGAAVGAVVTVGSAVVGSTVKVAGKVVEKTIDIVTPGSTPAPVPK